MTWNPGGDGGKTNVTDSATNGKIIVDGQEMTVYDDTAMKASIAEKAPSTHRHTLSQIDDVDDSAKVSGNVLTYDSASGEVKLKPLPAGSGSGATNLDGLTDVDVTTIAPAAGDALVFGNGQWKPGKVAGGSGVPRQEIAFEFDIQNFTVSDEQPMLHIPVEAYNAGSRSVVHPSVLYFESKWNGYHYWMGINPYAGINFENPAIFVSHDGLTWFPPPGLTNPIDGIPPGGGYGSDINLFLDKDGKTLHALNRHYFDTFRKLYIYSSTNGVNWTSRQVILESLDASFDFLSPSILLEEDGTYTMWTVDLTRQIGPLAIKDEIDIYKATDARGPWTKVRTVFMPKLLPNERIWHLEVRKIASFYYMFYQTCDLVQSGAAGQTYFARSLDGNTWDPCTTAVSSLFDTWGAASYKSSFLPSIDGDGVKFKLWHNVTEGAGKFWLGYLELKIQPKRKAEYNVTGKKLIFQDTFDDPTLAKWSLQTGSPLLVVADGVASNIGAPGTGKVYKVLPVNDYIVNMTVEEIAHESKTFGTIFYVNSQPDNDWEGMQFGYERNKLICMIRKNANTINKLYIRQVLQKGDVITFEVSYTNKYIKVFINGYLKFNYTNADDVMLPRNTRIGFNAASTGFTGRFALQDISVYAIDYKEPATIAVESQMKLLASKGDDYKGDNFKRANGAVGTMLDGTAWTVAVGTYAIESNKLKSSSTPPGAIFADTGWLDCSAEISTNVNGGVVMRYVDVNNYLHVDYSANTVRVRKTVAGVVTTLATFPFPATGLKVVGATVAVGRLKAYLNGRVVYDEAIADSVFATSTKTGVYTNGSDSINYILVTKA